MKQFRVFLIFAALVFLALASNPDDTKAKYFLVGAFVVAIFAGWATLKIEKRNKPKSRKKSFN